MSSTATVSLTVYMWTISFSIEGERHAVQVGGSQHISSCRETFSFLKGLQVCQSIDMDVLKCINEYSEIWKHVVNVGKMEKTLNSFYPRISAIMLVGRTHIITPKEKRLYFPLPLYFKKKKKSLRSFK